MGHAPSTLWRLTQVLVDDSTREILGEWYYSIPKWDKCASATTPSGMCLTLTADAVSQAATEQISMSGIDATRGHKSAATLLVNCCSKALTYTVCFVFRWHQSGACCLHKHGGEKRWLLWRREGLVLCRCHHHLTAQDAMQPPRSNRHN
jgi:hypothetical protein